MRLKAPRAAPRLAGTWRIRWAALLAAALLWAQCLGVWHHTLHASGGLPQQIQAEVRAQGLEPWRMQGQGGRATLDGSGGPRAGAADAAAQAAVGHESAAEASPVSSLFHHAAGGIECRLLDQLLLGDAAPVAHALATPDLPAAAPPVACSGLLLPLTLLRAYLARAPPGA